MSMKKSIVTTITTIFTTLVSFIAPISLFSQSSFYDYFTTERLRVDLVLAGDASGQSLFLDGFTKEPGWSGPRENLNEPFNYGEYQMKVFTTNGENVFTKGFNTLFQEWRTTAEAKEIKRAFSLSVTMPFPKVKMVIKFYERERSSGIFKEIASIPVDPSDKLIVSGSENTYKITPIIVNGHPWEKVDLLFIAEGYTEQEMDKFRQDCKRFAEYLFSVEPYSSRKNDFNIYALEAVSTDSGTDIPHMDIWKNTALSSNFYTFRIDRYLTAPDHKKVASAASAAHYDALYVIVNTDKYGGGGVYNYYGLSMSDHKQAAEVFVHELGHSFAGLGDEYYSSEVAYEEFYNLKTEPWEPNLTTLVNFDSKWRSLIKEGVPIPTPSIEMYKSSTGLFEGGGYMSKGIYRPALDCRMKSNSAQGFCEVCRDAISAVIDYHTKNSSIK